MQIWKIKSALVRTYANVERNRTLQMGAALSYYFVMALFPALIFLSAIVAFLPVAGLFDQALDLMGRFVPTEGMGIVRKVLSDAVTPNRSTFLSIGFVGTLWTASGGFAAAIEALNVAYDVDEMSAEPFDQCNHCGNQIPPAQTAVNSLDGIRFIFEKVGLENKLLNEIRGIRGGLLHGGKSFGEEEHKFMVAQLSNLRHALI